MVPWSEEALALSRRLAISLGQFEDGHSAEERGNTAMGIRRTMEESEFTPLDPGTYPVTCLAVTADTLENPQFGNGDIIRFKLRFDDKLTPMSKLTGFLTSFNVRCEIGVEVDLDECVGRQALARVETVEKNGKTYDKITDILPPIAKAKNPTGDMSDFWQAVREAGYENATVLKTLKDAGKPHPKDMTPEQRQEVLDELGA